MVERLKIAVMGAPGVGKTSIVQRFVRNSYTDEYSASVKRKVYHTAVVVNDQLYELTILDIPGVLPHLRANSLHDWQDFHDFQVLGSRNERAFILVYDISCRDSFEYIKLLREQIIETRRTALSQEVPVVIVGNKRDLADRRVVPRRDVASLVRKTWKCGYIECSAKYNWHVTFLFKELMKNVVYGGNKNIATSVRLNGNMMRNRCRTAASVSVICISPPTLTSASAHYPRCRAKSLSYHIRTQIDDNRRRDPSPAGHRVTSPRLITQTYRPAAKTTRRVASGTRLQAGRLTTVAFHENQEGNGEETQAIRREKHPNQSTVNARAITPLPPACRSCRDNQPTRQRGIAGRGKKWNCLNQTGAGNGRKERGLNEFKGSRAFTDGRMCHRFTPSSLAVPSL
ncbi:Ras-like protein member [Branchiostoma belcheri]|nr:Ras-like protein member [Branchiostoma belcheri]